MAQLDLNDKTAIIMSEIMTPDMVNFSGHIHGGHVMSLFDRVAYACAARYCSMNVVTVSVDQIIFKQPIFVNELLICLAKVNYVGSTSMEIGIKVVAENLTTGEKRHTNTCFFTMVAVNNDGKPCPVPKLELKNDIDRFRFKEAQARRLLQRQYKEAHFEEKTAIRQKNNL